MGTINTYTAYHATDKKKVQSILDNNFIYNYHDDHWLGNGVYFFLDAGLAYQWAENPPTDKYGQIENPAIIQAEIEIDSDHVADLRNLDDYNYAKQAFDAYLKKMSKKKSAGGLSMATLRCGFFDWFVEEYDVYCVIAYLDERKSLPVYTEHGDVFKKFKIPYLEVQMCVSQSSCIITRQNKQLSK